MSSPELSRSFAEALRTDWHSIARANQLPPDGDWRIWLLMAGRGFGKTRCGAEWVREQAETAAAKRIALVGPTASDCRDVLIEGESGILAISPRHVVTSSWRPKRVPFARHLGLTPQTLINIERGHRKLQAAELFVLAFALGKSPEWMVREIERRFEDEIGQWRKESGYGRKVQP
jgi:DNA-binding XRE family transcriptional regulator